MAITATALNLAPREWAKDEADSGAGVQTRTPQRYLSDPHIFLSPTESTTNAVIHPGEYNKCIMHWEPVHPERQKVLLERMKKFIDDQIALGIGNDYRHVNEVDAMGNDISDVAGLFW